MTPAATARFSELGAISTSLNLTCASLAYHHLLSNLLAARPLLSLANRMLTSDHSLHTGLDTDGNGALDLEDGGNDAAANEQNATGAGSTFRALVKPELGRVRRATGINQNTGRERVVLGAASLPKIRPLDPGNGVRSRPRNLSPPVLHSGTVIGLHYGHRRLRTYLHRPRREGRRGRKGERGHGGAEEPSGEFSA